MALPVHTLVSRVLVRPLVLLLGSSSESRWREGSGVGQMACFSARSRIGFTAVSLLGVAVRFS